MKPNKTRSDVLIAAFAAAILASTGPLAAEQIQVDFVDHLEAGLQEMDVFVTGQNDDEVHRVNPSTKDGSIDKPVYAAAGPVPHDPFDFSQNGPYPKGKPLGFTLKEWLSAQGSATVGCEDGKGSVQASFSNLVADGVYTMWFALVPTPPTEPFTGSLDLPVGARDGSGSVFVADAAGDATYEISFDGCLEMSSTNFMSLLAIAWHSDGKTYAASPGPFGSVSHVQMFAPLPKQAGGES